MGSTGSFVAASARREWGGRPYRPGDEDLEARQRLCCSYHRLLLLSDSFSSMLREGVPRGTRGGDTPPALFFMTIGTAGPEDETEGCPWSESAIRHERGHPE